MAWTPTPLDVERMRIEGECQRFLQEINKPMSIELQNGDYVEADPEAKLWLLNHGFTETTLITSEILNPYIAQGVFVAEPLDKDLTGKFVINLVTGQKAKANNERKFRLRLADSE